MVRSLFLDLFELLHKYARYIFRTSKYLILEKEKNDISNDGVQYGLPDSYRSRRAPSFDDHFELDSSDIVWQPDVYALAAKLARITGAEYLLDVGCGHAGKLAPFHNEFKLIGVDTEDNTSWCKDNYNFGQWLAIDLDNAFPTLPADAKNNTVVICSDVIEHIYDIDAFIESFSDVLGECCLGVLSTPDRTNLYPSSHRGPPLNPCHVREWRVDELKKYFEAKGIDAWLGLTRSNTNTNQLQTIIAIVEQKKTFATTNQ